MVSSKINYKRTDEMRRQGIIWLLKDEYRIKIRKAGLGPAVVHWPPSLYLLNYVPTICVLLVNIWPQRKTCAYFKQCYISSRLKVQAHCAAIFIYIDFLRCLVSPPLRLSTLLSSWHSQVREFQEKLTGRTYFTKRYFLFKIWKWK